MSKNMKTLTVKLIPIDKINILNPRVRNQKVFKDIVANIAQVGLKRPVTVTRCHSGVPGKDYDLICGQGRIEAFITRGQTKIPALVIDVDEETALIMFTVSFRSPVYIVDFALAANIFSATWWQANLRASSSS